MPFDPVSAPLLATIGKTAYNWIKQISDAKIIISKNLTFYHQDSELEFSFVVSLGGARVKRNRIVQRILPPPDASIEFENVLSIAGNGLECGENLVTLDAISLSKDTAKIDFGKLYGIKSSTVLIRIRTKASAELKRLLVFCRIEQIPQHTETKIESRIEVALDYANLWSKIFDQYVVRDIEFTATLNIDLYDMLNRIFKKQAKKITKAAEQAVQGNANAIRFLNIMTESFLSFESDEVISRLRRSVSVTPENFILKEIHPAMQYVEMPSIGYPIVLPGRMRISVGCVLDGNQFIAHGRLVIDVKKFSEVLREIAQDVQLKTRKLRF